MRSFRSIAGAAFAAAVSTSLCAPVPAFAQSSDYFIPGGQQGTRPAQAPAPRPAPVQRRPEPRSESRQAPQMQLAPQQPQQQQAGPAEPQLQMALPPAPELTPLPKGAAPPTAVIGVMGVPEVMRAASAAQQVEKIIGQRREKLNEDAQKEQNTWREMQQALANERTKLSPEQIRSREKDLQERVTNAQKTFRERNTIIQEAAQYGLSQIERTLIGVIRQVAESRGMNLVLHRQQVALNVAEFDITDQVTAQLNKVLPTVQIPADGVAPPVLPGNASATAAAPSATPVAAAPASPATPAPASPAAPAPAATAPAAK